MQSLFESESLGAVIIGVWRAASPCWSERSARASPECPRRWTCTTAPATSATRSSRRCCCSRWRRARSRSTTRCRSTCPTCRRPTRSRSTWSRTAPRATAVHGRPEFQAKLYEDPFADWDIDDVIAYGVDGGPQYTPGTDWNFSDTNILILAQVLEEATGTPIADLVQEGIFDPLGMDQSTSPATAYLPDPVLHAYTGERGVWEEATFWHPSWTSFAGGWGSTQDDLRKLIEAVGTGALLSDESHEAQLAPTSVGLGSSTDERYYGMGISIVNDWLLTAPGLQGYHASVGYLRDQELTVVIYFTTTPEYDASSRSTLIFEPLSAILAPENAVDLG